MGPILDSHDEQSNSLSSSASTVSSSSPSELFPSAGSTSRSTTPELPSDAVRDLLPDSLRRANFVCYILNNVEADRLCYILNKVEADKLNLALSHLFESYKPASNARRRKQVNTHVEKEREPQFKEIQDESNKHGMTQQIMSNNRSSDLRNRVSKLMQDAERLRAKNNNESHVDKAKGPEHHFENNSDKGPNNHNREEELDVANRKISKLVKEIKNQRIEHQSTLERLTEVSKKVQEVKKDRNEAEMGLVQALDRLRKLRTDLEQLTTETSPSQDNNRDCMSEESDINEPDQVLVNRLEHAIEEKLDRQKAAEDKIKQTLQVQLTGLQGYTAELEDRRKTLEEDATRLQNDNLRLQEEVNGLRETNGRLNGEINTLSKDFNRSRQDTDQINEKFQAEIEEQEEIIHHIILQSHILSELFGATLAHEETVAQQRNDSEELNAQILEEFERLVADKPALEVAYVEDQTQSPRERLSGMSRNLLALSRSQKGRSPMQYGVVIKGQGEQYRDASISQRAQETPNGQLARDLHSMCKTIT